uniref:Uncharacterized protein n=1 Tax=Picea sitchensis TaxID=3332 RepID=B8LP87_PICSI|nr:unknown [Picea sitchensis]
MASTISPTSAPIFCIIQKMIFMIISMILLGWKFHYSTRFCWRKFSNGGGDESRDVEALLFFKKTIKFDPAGYLCN